MRLEYEAAEAAAVWEAAWEVWWEAWWEAVVTEAVVTEHGGSTVDGHVVSWLFQREL